MLLAAAWLCSIPASAQVKRPTTTRPTTSRTTTTPQKPAEKRWGCYELRASHIAATDSVIYYLESEENNALMSLDCETGAVKTVIPGIKGVYEGARPLFRNVVATGGKLLLCVTKENKKGIYVWDGQSLSTSKKLAGNSYEIAAYNGKYLLTYSEPKNKDGDVVECFLLWDLEQMKALIRYPLYDSSSSQNVYHRITDNPALMDTTGTMWIPYGMGVLRIPRQGKNMSYPLKGAYIDQIRDDRGSDWYDNVSYTQMTLAGDYVYVAFHRRVYRMNVYEPGTWEEYAKMPATQEGSFSKVAAFADGSLLTHSEVNYKYITHYFPAGKFDEPVTIGERPSLPTTGHFINMDRECWISLNCMQYDCHGNVLVLTNGKETPINLSLDTGDLWILNPKGINGFKNVVGRVVEMK